MEAPAQGDLNWRLSAHPFTLLFFLLFRIAPLLVYLFGVIFTGNFILIFIITILLLSTDFYHLKNIAGRRLVGLRWWNEVNPQSGDSHMVFESLSDATAAPPSLNPAQGIGPPRQITATDKRFFWLALYTQPLLWVGLAIVAIVRLEFIWLSLVVIALILGITNTVAFSRCDKFGQANAMAGNALYGSGVAKNVVGGFASRMFSGFGGSR